jgi:hypothetical protein
VKQSGSRQRRRREIFVLTPEEKRSISFVLIMFLLGATTVHYRTANFVKPTTTAIQETAKIAGLRAQKRAESRHRNSP